MFYQMVKRVSIDIFEFLALLMGLLFYYTKMNSFVKAAIALNFVNGQTMSYLAFAILLIILPIVLLSAFRKLDKGMLLRLIFYAFGTVIIVGTIFDVITYNCFIDYTYIEGDAIFVNLMWNMPNITGVILSLIVSLLYFALGKQIKRKRRISFMLYASIFIISHIPPMLFTIISTGALPRDTYLQKSLYVLAIQLLILVALAIAASARTLWKQHVWN